MNFTILFIVMEYIAIIYAFGLIYKLVGWKNSTYIQRNLGWVGYCVLGTVGVTYHELSHLVTAVIFGHKINEVRLFRPLKGKVDGTLGYVKHSWNDRSMYQIIGNFFIGTAPMFFGAGLLFTVLRFAYPSVFVDAAGISEIPDSLRFAFGMLKPENVLTAWTPVVLSVALLICPHMHMSWADVKGAASGAIALMVTASVLSLASTAMPGDWVTRIQGGMNTFITYYIYALVLGLIMSLIMTAFFGLMSLVRGKGL